MRTDFFELTTSQALAGTAKIRSFVNFMEKTDYRIKFRRDKFVWGSCAGEDLSPASPRVWPGHCPVRRRRPPTDELAQVAVDEAGRASASILSSSASNALASWLTMAAISGCAPTSQPSRSSVKPDRRAAVNWSTASKPG